MSSTVLWNIINLWKTFPTAKQATTVLQDISLTVNQGEFVIIYGPSGSGKSTLLHTLLGLESPSKGQVFFRDNDVYRLTEDQRTRLRKKNIGMVYQQSLWIHALNVAENVALPLLLQGQPYPIAYATALQALEAIGMKEWELYVPTELSSGQQQRISLARAIIIKPLVIVADEPTGNLDYENGKELLEKLKKINNLGTTIIMVTHDLSYLSYADHAFEIVNGKVHSSLNAQQIKQKMARHVWPTATTEYKRLPK